ncbi:unnamed protein product, partial [Trichobilharzia szidati]
ILHVCLVNVRKLRAMRAVSVLTMLLVIILWSGVTVIYCYKVNLMCNLLALAITAFVGIISITVGFTSRPLSDRGYFVLYLISVVLILIGFVFYLIFQIFRFPYNLVSGTLVVIGEALVIYYNSSWLRYTTDTTLKSAMFKTYLECFYLIGVFLTIVSCEDKTICDKLSNKTGDES